MPKYIVKRTVVEAIQWNVDNTWEVFTLIGHIVPVFWDHPRIEGGKALVITRFSDGSELVFPGDWVIKDSRGEVSRCEADYFERTYEAAP
jgi:hypothetical protein